MFEVQNQMYSPYILKLHMKIMYPFHVYAFAIILFIHGIGVRYNNTHEGRYCKYISIQ